MTRPSLASFAITIPPGGSDEVHRAADFITCLSASHAFQLALDGGPVSDFESGLTFKPTGGLRLTRINNPDPVHPLTLQLGFGRGDILDNRTSFSGTIDVMPAGNFPVETVSPDVLTTGAPISCEYAAVTALAAANSKRVEVMVTNTGGATVYVGGDPAASPGEGIPVSGGASLVLSSGAAIYARNDTVAAVEIAVAEMERS